MEVTGKDYDACHDMLYNNGYKVYTSIDMEAQELLQTTECSMKEICVKTGYSDPNYFSRSFKKNVGVTPTEYKENRGKGQEQGSV